MDINSRSSRPRGEDEQARRLIRQNWSAIEKLADQIRRGRSSADKARQAALDPQASVGFVVDPAVQPAPGALRPHVRVGVNGWVILTDLNSGRQLRLLGQVKPVNGVTRFVIARKDNGHYSLLDDSTHSLIGDLADVVINQQFSEQDLEQELQTRLNVS